MARLPKVGDDKGTWGGILNEFLEQSHDSDGTLKADTVGAVQLKPNAVTSAALANSSVTAAKIADGAVGTDQLADEGVTTQKLASFAEPDGVASLDGDGRLPEAQVPERLSESELSSAYAGLGGLVWYDDFSRYADGPISGAAPMIGPEGQTWGVSGAQVPVISNGALVSSGVGYAYANLGTVADVLLAEVEWINPGSVDCAAMAWVNGESFNLDLLANHVSFGPRAEYATVKRGVNFPPLMPQFPWRSRMVAGQRYIVALAIVGDQLVVTGNGDVHTSPPDTRVNTLPGNIVFWEPLTVSGSSVKIHRVAAYKFDDRHPTSIFARLTDIAAAGIYRATNDAIVASAYSQAETKTGDSSDTMPGITYGASEIRARVTSPASAGATTILLSKLVPAGTVITINPNASNAETVTSSGYPIGSGPYTVTVSALANAHSADEMVSAVPPASRRLRSYLNMSNGFFFLPDAPQIVVPGDNLALGDQLDAFVSRAAAGVIYVGPTMRTGRGVTGARPSASAAGQGSQWFDTTLGKPIWSDGSVWRDATGTTV